MIPDYYWGFLTKKTKRQLCGHRIGSETRQRVFVLWSGIARNGQEFVRNLFS